MSRTLAVLGLVVAVAAAAAGVAYGEDSGGGRSGCPSQSRVLAQTAAVAVVRSPTGDIVACLRRSPISAVLTKEYYFEQLYRSPALAIKGTRVAYAITNFEDPMDAEFTQIFVLDLGRRESDGVTVAEPKDYSARESAVVDVRITRIVLRSDGAVAWIACSTISSPPPSRVRPGGECSRPGHEESMVFVVTSDGRRSELAFGTTVDPQFLRLQGHGRVAWRANGRTRSARVR